MGEILGKYLIGTEKVPDMYRKRNGENLETIRKAQ